MGLDIEGIAPTSVTGTRFCVSFWEWRPLAKMMLCFGGKVAAQGGAWDAGDGLDARNCAQLARMIEQALRHGAVADYLEQRAHYLASPPRNLCSTCNASGLLESAGECVPCIHCHGTGQLSGIESWYHLDREIVEGFLVFLRTCGGFYIS